jgi:hypothetical protein
MQIHRIQIVTEIVNNNYKNDLLSLDLRTRKQQEATENCILRTFTAYYYGDQLLEDEIQARHLASMRKKRSAYKIVVRKPKRKKPFERSRNK